MRREPLIIGGGPAGVAAAITLGRAGCRPVLLERTSGPTDKVCGDFLSGDAIEQVRLLGVDPFVLGAAPIGRVRLIHGERTAETALPFPACGLSRRVLDAALLAQAEREGAVVRTGQNVRRLSRDGGEWTAEAGGAAITADSVFLATGKHDVRDLPRPHSAHGSVGMKMYFSLSSDASKNLEGAIELTLFAGGYAGMQVVEAGQVVLCLAVQRAAFQRYGGGWQGVIAAITQASRRFGGMLKGARSLLPRPLAVAGIPYGYQAGAAALDGLFRLGDQAAVIPSLTGDGMAIALLSGRIAAETWLRGGDSATYHGELSRLLNPQMRLAEVLHRAFMSGAVQAAVVRGAGMLPFLMRRAARRTRVRLVA
jgi:flavin-dependent dehydrogenase